MPTDDRSATVTLGASLRGSVEFGPVPLGQTWQVTSVTVFAVLAGTTMPAARVYRNTANPANMIDGTYTGAQDVSTIPVDLHAGEKLVVEWTTGNAGDVCTARIGYTYENAGQA